MLIPSSIRSSQTLSLIGVWSASFLAGPIEFCHFSNVRDPTSTPARTPSIFRSRNSGSSHSWLLRTQANIDSRPTPWKSAKRLSDALRRSSALCLRQDRAYRRATAHTAEGIEPPPPAIPESVRSAPPPPARGYTRVADRLHRAGQPTGKAAIARASTASSAMSC